MVGGGCKMPILTTGRRGRDEVAAAKVRAGENPETKFQMPTAASSYAPMGARSASFSAWLG